MTTLSFPCASHRCEPAAAFVAMSDLQAFISGEAELGSESDDGDFDEETGENRRKQNGARHGFEDSSEEEEEDDEEEAQRVRVTF